MASGSVRKLVVVPAVISHLPEGLLAPVEAVQGVLAGHAKAAHLLSEARHRSNVASESADEAVRAARLDRDAEMAYDIAVRASDRHGHWRLHFGPAAVAVAALLIACWAAVFALTQGLPRLDQVVIPLAAAGFSATVAWRSAAGQERKSGHVAAFTATAVSAAALSALGVLGTAGGLLLRVAESAALGLVVAAVGIAAIWVMDHAEIWHCARLRRASDHAARYRQEAAAAAWRDEAEADAALAAWESLVTEECQLAHPGPAGGDAWLAECVTTAHQIARPQ
jgi:hypothetical protein